MIDRVPYGSRHGFIRELFKAKPVLTVAEIVAAMPEGEDARAVRIAVCVMHRRGELVRVARGTYKPNEGHERDRSPYWLARAIKLRSKGLTFENIGRRLGVHRKVVSYHLRKAQDGERTDAEDQTKRQGQEG